MISKILPDFQEFLASHALVDKKHAPFYVRWVSKFLAFPHKQEKQKINLVFFLKRSLSFFSLVNYFSFYHGKLNL